MMPGLAAQFLRYASVGGIATGAHYALLILLVESGAAPVLTASAAGALLGAGVGYLLNHRFTFRSDRRHRKALPRFLTVAGLAFAANLALMALLYDAGELPYLLAQVLTTAAILALTFTLNRVWSF